MQMKNYELPTRATCYSYHRRRRLLDLCSGRLLAAEEEDNNNGNRAIVLRINCGFINFKCQLIAILTANYLIVGVAHVDYYLLAIVLSICRATGN